MDCLLQYDPILTFWAVGGQLFSAAALQQQDLLKLQQLKFSKTAELQLASRLAEEHYSLVHVKSELKMVSESTPALKPCQFFQLYNYILLF